MKGDLFKHSFIVHLMKKLLFSMLPNLSIMSSSSFSRPLLDISLFLPVVFHPSYIVHSSRRWSALTSSTFTGSPFPSSSLSLATCPANLHFSFAIFSMMYSIPVHLRISVFFTWSMSLIPNIDLSIFFSLLPLSLAYLCCF